MRRTNRNHPHNSRKPRGDPANHGQPDAQGRPEPRPRAGRGQVGKCGAWWTRMAKGGSREPSPLWWRRGTTSIMHEASRYTLRINDHLSNVSDNMADAMRKFKYAFEVIEASGNAGHARLDALFPTPEQADDFASQFAKSAEVLSLPNRTEIDPAACEAFTACVWASYNPTRDGVSNEAAHRRIKSILRTASKANL